MKEDLYDDLYEEKEEKIDFHALLFRYVIRWPWFVASVIICLAGAWLHLRQTTPVYNISASVIIKDDKKGGNSGGTGGHGSLFFLLSLRIDRRISLLSLSGFLYLAMVIIMLASDTSVLTTENQMVVLALMSAVFALVLLGVT